MKTVLFSSLLLLFLVHSTFAITAENNEKTPPLRTFYNADAARQLLDHGIEEMVFIKRYTLNGNHFYTEYVNSTWTPGGNLCVLNLKTGKTRDLVPQLKGVFNRFDISFEGDKVLFDFKSSQDSGYRIYEVNLDGSNLRQVTFPQPDEQALVSSYSNGNYHHGTDDMHPCYLADGGIAFVSTRCKYGILCDSPDNFTTKILYRMDYDGSNMVALSNSSVSEASPVVLPDGRIMYHRWEYNDKAAGNAKCLWAMQPDGSASVEVYGNTLSQPENLIFARPIPNEPNKILSLATSHCCPNNAMGTVIVIDKTKNLRTKEPITYITKDVDAQSHNGFHFLIDTKWVHDMSGSQGRLFRDPYPISSELFLVSHKPKGFSWDHKNAYDLYLLNAEGEVTPLFLDKTISCWLPFPVISRERPQVAALPKNEKLAKQNKAHCIVTDVYAGMPEVERGSVKYIRIMEQVPRPWTARTRWDSDRDGMAHTALGYGKLGLKVQHGVVPVEKDGSAFFEVPADRNIYFQALDANYMAVQTERTYINYKPGETRSCIGCHETSNTAPQMASRKTPIALKREVSKALPQPGDKHAEKVINYMTQVQPVLDKHCISCHGEKEPQGGLCLTGELSGIYTKSYKNLTNRNNGFAIPYIGELTTWNENVGSADISYQNAFTSGSHTSPLVTVLKHGCIPLRHPKGEEVLNRFVRNHPKIDVNEEEFVNVVNWLDSFAQFYPSYWGLKHEKYQSEKYFRPEVTFQDAVSRTIPSTLQELYANPPKIVER